MKKKATELSYGELLQDPRWQRKRLEIMRRDGFECCHCEAKDKTLHVNHRWYKARKKPWEYDDEVLETLCKDCHKEVTDAQARIKDALMRISSSQFGRIASYLEASIAASEVTGIAVGDYGSAQGVADCLHVTVDMVIKEAIERRALTHEQVLDLEVLGVEIEAQLDGRRGHIAEDAGTDEVDFA